MPGLVGTINKGIREENEALLKSMMGCMLHESFYVYGTYSNEETGVYVGWVCHKDSFSDCMPVRNEAGNIILLFAGENYADPGDILDLKRKSHDIIDGNDASYLVHLYEEQGDHFVQSLNGCFHGVLIDLSRRKVLLFNDRYGMQRLYYHESKDAFYFSSEAKALLRMKPKLKAIDQKGLAEYLTCGCVLEDRTMFPDVYVLPAGSAWSFSETGCVRKKKYFLKEEWENRERLSKELFYAAIEARFRKILPLYSEGRQRVAVSLTGGLDTRMIMACLRKKPDQLPCYTFGGNNRDSYDVQISREVAKICHQPHTTLYLDDDYLNHYREYAEKTVYVSDGCLDACSAYELYFNKLARAIAPVRLTGNYGSEVLRGVRALKENSWGAEIIQQDMLPLMKEAKQTLRSIGEVKALSFVAFKQVPWYGYGRLSVEQSQLTLRTPFLDNEFVRLVYLAPAEATANEKISLRLIAENNHALAEIYTDRGVSLHSNRLTRLSREAFFKAEYYFNSGMPHWLAKINAIMRPIHIEEWFLGRNKFHRYRIWFRDRLSDYLKSVLLDEGENLWPFADRRIIEQMIVQHVKGARNYTNEFNMMITIQLMKKLLVSHM